MMMKQPHKTKKAIFEVETRKKMIFKSQQHSDLQNHLNQITSVEDLKQKPELLGKLNNGSIIYRNDFFK